jgi:hypothetical protein
MLSSIERYFGRTHSLPPGRPDNMGSSVWFWQALQSPPPGRVSGGAAAGGPPPVAAPPVSDMLPCISAVMAVGRAIAAKEDMLPAPQRDKLFQEKVRRCVNVLAWVACACVCMCASVYLGERA